MFSVPKTSESTVFRCFDVGQREGAVGEMDVTREAPDPIRKAPDTYPASVPKKHIKIDVVLTVAKSLSLYPKRSQPTGTCQ